MIRHGEPDISGDDLKDPPLTELGHAQAAATASFLTATDFDAIYASPQQRAQQTMQPFLAGRGIEPVTDPRIAEFDYELGSYLPPWFGEDITREEAARRFAEMQGPDFHARVLAGMTDIVSANPGRTVAVVCHGGVISSYVRHVLEASKPLSPIHASITRIAVSRKGVSNVVSFNEHHWVPRRRRDPNLS